MRILRNHALSEFSLPFIFSVGAFLFLFLIGRGLVQMADFIFNKSIDIFLVFRLLYYSLPFILIFIIPISILLSTLMTFGKLSYDNEITALRASGISLVKFVRPLFFLIFLLCAFSFILSDSIASYSHYQYRLLLKQIGIENPAAALEEGVFIKKFKNFVIFIYEIDKNKLKGVRIYQPQEGKPTRTITAQKVEIIAIPEQGIIKLRLIQGTSDEPDTNDPSKFYTLNFRTYDFPLNISDARESQELGKKPKDMTVAELKREIDNLGDDGIQGTYPLAAEIHHKYALAFSGLPFFLIGVPLGITTRRSDKSVNLALSLLLMTVYWVILIAGKALAQKGLLHPFLALQAANVLMGSVGIFLFVRMARR